MFNNQKGFTPIIIIIIVVGAIVAGGLTGGIFYLNLTKKNESKLSKSGIFAEKCGDGICQIVEKQNGLCQKDCLLITQSSKIIPIPSIQQMPSTKPTLTTKPMSTVKSEPISTPNQQSFGDNSFDADGFLWGTAVGDSSNTNNKNAINNTLKTKYVKQILSDNIFTEDGKTFISEGCLPSFSNCTVKINLDTIANDFKNYGWSMMPMISHDPNDSIITASDIDIYVNFAEWFVSKYKNTVNIKYVELNNDPSGFWKGTKEQLLEANNRIYDKIKNKYPDILMGTPGFEYWFDDTNDQRTVSIIPIIDYFLNKNNGAKFDFWAFHGYPTTGKSNSTSFSFYPPTKTAISNKYSDINGILEIRKKMDLNGWQSRKIIDTEHIGGVYQLRSTISDSDDKLEAAYDIQELILKRTLKTNGSSVLTGIFPLKIRSRGSQGEDFYGSLNSNGSLTKTVKAIAFLWSKLNEYNYSFRISGEWDNETMVWIEKFIQGNNKELYIFFKPFKYIANQNISLDGKILNYTLNLTKTPSKITLTDINGNKTNVSSSQTINLEAINSPKFLEINY